MKSSRKDIRRTRRRTARNVESLTRIASLAKELRSAETPEAAQGVFKRFSSLLDRAAQKELIHWRKAARKKSRMAAMLAGRFAAPKAA